MAETTTDTAKPAGPTGSAGFFVAFGLQSEDRYGPNARLPPTIVVPGSISNLGPGFDALSVAVQVYLRARIVEVRPAEPDTIAWEFDGAGPTGENRIESAFRLARERVGTPAPGLRVQVSSDIPQTAGLGSSAAAAVAGLRLYESVTAPRPRKTGSRWRPSSKAIPTTRQRRSSAASR